LLLGVVRLCPARHRHVSGVRERAPSWRPRPGSSLTRVDPGVVAWARVVLRHARPNRRISAGWRAAPWCARFGSMQMCASSVQGCARACVASFASDGFERSSSPVGTMSGARARPAPVLCPGDAVQPLRFRLAGTLAMTAQSARARDSIESVGFERLFSYAAFSSPAGSINERACAESALCRRCDAAPEAKARRGRGSSQRVHERRSLSARFVGRFW
jgi:hypothetical protein